MANYIKIRIVATSLLSHKGQQVLLIIAKGIAANGEFDRLAGANPDKIGSGIFLI